MFCSPTHETCEREEQKQERGEGSHSCPIHFLLEPFLLKSCAFGGKGETPAARAKRKPRRQGRNPIRVYLSIFMHVQSYPLSVPGRRRRRWNHHHQYHHSSLSSLSSKQINTWTNRTSVERRHRHVQTMAMRAHKWYKSQRGGIRVDHPQIYTLQDNV